MSDYLKELFIDEVKGSLGDKNSIVLDALLNRDITALSSDMTEVKSHTFANCEKLVDIELNSATTIGDYAFYNCSRLGDAIYPEVVTIGNHAFDGCSTMNKVQFPKAEIIGDYAFYNCTGFMNPRFFSIKRIGDYAFYNARIGITASASLPWWDITKIEYIGDYAFYKNTMSSTWSELSFPVLTHVGKYAFRYCSSKNIDMPLITHIPEGVLEHSLCTTFSASTAVSVGKKAFDTATIETVSLPNIISVDDEAFFHCIKLTSIELPSATTIGDRVFKECVKLNTIKLPEATYLGSEALAIGYNRTYGLKHVDLSKITKLHADVFGTPKRPTISKLILRNSNVVEVITSDTVTQLTVPLSANGYIYVPSELVSTYQSDTYWSRYAEKFRALEDYTVDGTTTGELDETKI